MATTTKSFAYEAQTAQGQVFKGTLDADSPDDLLHRLSQLQLHVLNVSPTEAPKKVRSALPADDFLVFNQQLAHLTQAGLPMERGLRLIAIDLRSGKLSRAAQDIAQELEKGTSLQEAFAKNASRFPPLYGKLIDAGVTSGNLPGMLFNLGKHLELMARLRRSLWRTLSYPFIVLSALSLLMLFISTVVLPHFEDIYNGFRVTLPALTTLMLKMGHVYPWLFGIFWGSVLVVALVDGTMRAGGGRGISWARAMRHVPVIGGILKSSLLAGWIDSLRLGIESGLDLPRAISLAADSTGDPSLIRDAQVLSDTVSRGLPLLGFVGRTIPPTIAAAIELAGQTGDLPSALLSLSRMYEQQAEHRLRVLPAIMSPLLLIVMAIGVGTTVVSMMLPLVKLIQSVSGD